MCDMKKTITCKTCGAEISPRAKRCPNCGEMTPNELLRLIILGLVLAPFIILILSAITGFYVGWFNWSFY